jgi:16S rRNA G966 N2-methylase RsmD
MKFPAYKDLIHEQSPHLSLFPSLIDKYADFYTTPDTYNYCTELLCLRGKLFKAEILTLLELAHYVNGPVLELGCFHGASTIAMCKANSDVTTIDISEAAIQQAEKNFLKHNVKPRVVKAEAVEGMKILALENKKFNFVFIDHDHSYETMYYSCAFLPQLLQNKAYLYFHDFQDKRNETAEYGVYQAVKNTLSPHLDFIGLSGGGALFQWQK